MEFSDSEDLNFNTFADITESEQKLSALPEAETLEESPKLNMDEGLDFDFGQLTVTPDTPTKSEFADTESNFGHTMPGLDMSGFNTVESQPEAATDNANEINLSEINLSETNLSEIEFISTDDASETIEFPNIDEPVFTEFGLSEPVVVDENALAETDFSFDLSTLSPEAASYVEEEATANTFDLSAISLEMEDSATNDEAITLSAGEPIEIETKLDLVVAYLEMDDKEGAKEL